LNLKAQSDSLRIIQGIVYADHEKGLPGCNVMIKGTPEGTITDINGNFKLVVPRYKEVTLLVSCISEPTEIKTKLKKSYYKIKLE